MLKWVKKNKKLLITLLIYSIGCLVIFKEVKEKDSLFDIYKNQDLHFNIASINSIFAGFLFTSIGILISLLSKDSVKRLWDNGYLDCACNSIYAGIFLHVISILLSIVGIFKFVQNDRLIMYIVYIEISAMIAGVIVFIISALEMISTLKIFRRS